MLLYHGTSSANAQNIEVRGIIPNFKSNWTTPGKVRSHPKGVYLSDKYVHSAEFYGLRSAVLDNVNEYSVLTIEVNEEPLYPDENFLAKAEEETGAIYAPEMEKAILSIESNKALWKECLERKGIVVHFGEISPNKITKIDTKKIDQNPWAWLIEETGTIAEFDCKIEALGKAQHLGYMPGPATNYKLIRIIGDYTTRDLTYRIVRKDESNSGL